MTWIDELRDEIHRQSEGPRAGDVQEQAKADEDVAYAGRVVGSYLEQVNRELLGGSGSVWEMQARWGLRLWELWWQPSRAEGQHVIVTLLRDSRGTPYLKVQRRRLALRDPLLERRLQLALRAAFLQPSVYAPRVREPRGIQQLSQPAE